MKETTWTKFKTMKLEDIKKGECLKVTGDGEMAFIAVIKPEQEMRNRIESNCSLIDKSRGF